CTRKTRRMGHQTPRGQARKRDMPIIPLVGALPMQPASGVAQCCAMPPKPEPKDPPVAKPALNPPKLPARDSAVTPRKHAKRIPSPTCQCLIVLLPEVGRKEG